jgi:nicotinate dehydrogenase subunit A
MASTASTRISVNSHLIQHPGEDSDRLLTILHDQGLCASKLGCGTGHCGACTVWVGNACARACEVTLGSLASDADSSPVKITTLEGLAEADTLLARCLIEAFLVEQAAQCGYCTSGILMKAALLIRSHALAARKEGLVSLDEAQVALALDEHLCRCGSHRRVMRAVVAASENYLSHTLPDRPAELPEPLI